MAFENVLRLQRGLLNRPLQLTIGGLQRRTQPQDLLRDRLVQSRPVDQLQFQQGFAQENTAFLCRMLLLVRQRFVQLCIGDVPPGQ